jgi:hypothetical protein
VNKKLFWIIFALLAFFICIPLGMSFYRDYEVYTKGKIYKVTIKSLPGGSQSREDFMDFYIDDRVDYKRVYGNYSLMHHAGDTIRLRYLDEFKHHYLFEDENPVSWGILVLIIIASCGIICSYYALKKDPPVIMFPLRRKQR